MYFRDEKRGVDRLSGSSSPATRQEINAATEAARKLSHNGSSVPVTSEDRAKLFGDDAAEAREA